MSQIFRPSSNRYSKLSLISVVLILIFMSISSYAYFQSSYYNDVGVFIEQPIPFSHKNHVQGLGLNCVFCHTSVEKSATAGIPSTEVCMSCHSQIYQKSQVLKPLRDSFENNTAIKWNRVHKLPDYVYFNHSIHINKDISCFTCHGDVKEMESISKQRPMTMSWCLRCHSHPEKYINPEVNEVNIDRAQLTNCYTCHR
jgi:hypothetical protein